MCFGVSALTFGCYVWSFALTSPDIPPRRPAAQTLVFNGSGCSGANQSPALSWDVAPVTTRSFAVSIYDLDAQVGHGRWHWYVINLPWKMMALSRNAGKADGTGLPPGAVQLNTDFGTPAYVGPCPPVGDRPHHYLVTIHALKVSKLEVPADEANALTKLDAEVKANTIVEA